MVAYPVAFYIYFDKEVLQQEELEPLLQYLAERHRAMRLYVHDIWEQKEIEHSENMSYICESVYGKDFVDTVLLDIANNRKKERLFRNKLVLLMGNVDATKLKGTNIQYASIGEGKTYSSLEAFFKAKAIYDRRLFFTLLAILIPCVIYIIATFMFLDDLPLILNEGFLAFLNFMFPLLIIITCFYFGCKHGIFTFWGIIGGFLD